MSMNNPLATVLSRIQNAEHYGKQEFTVLQNSTLIKAVLSIMKNEGYIKEFKEQKDKKGDKLTITLSGRINKTGVVTPRFTVKNNNYERFEKRYLPGRDFGILLVTTNKGLMTHKQAKSEKLGGKLVAYAY